MKRLLYLLSACLMTFGFSACNDDDDNLKLQDISVEFAVSEAGMDGETVSLGLKLSRATTESLDVTMEMTSSDVSDADITTTPAMTDGKITVNIPAGQSTGTFTVAKATGKNPEGTAKFQILSLSLTEGYKIGTTKEMTLSFTPIVSTGGTMTLEGKVGDQNYANMVYVDLSNNSQMQIDRKSWNLGFYCGDEFRVVLNSSYATVAAASEKTDFAAVTLEDAQSAPNIAAGSMSEDFKAEWIDDVTGDLSKTAFGEISATDANNKVFFVASADNKTNTDGTENRSLWYKVKVTRSGNGYKVEKMNQLIRGWINYFKIGSMKTLCRELDGNIRYRLRMCIWKHWKTPQNKEKNLVKLGVPRWAAHKVANTGNRYAHMCHNGWIQKAISIKRLTSFGLVSMLDYYTERCTTC